MNKEIAPTKRVRFQVADVTPSTARLPPVDLMSALARTANTKLLVCPDAAREVVQDADFHPLIAAAAFAFQKHYPLALSPDMIWLTILQGVAQHINNNAEKLRGRLVHHQTKIELVVPTDLQQLPSDDAAMLALTKAFNDQIARHVHADKRSLLQAEFSTTTDVERIAANVVLMEAFQPYLDYVVGIICGIPSVILEGTVTDWELLGSKVQALHGSDLELSWWTQHLHPLCGHFVRAARGEVDLNHWRDLLKVMARYGFDDMNGWLLKFIPYVCAGRNRDPIHRNPVLELKVIQEEETTDSASNRTKITGCTSNMLPTGISGVPVTCHNKASGENLDLRFLAGFTGVEQNPEDLSLRPVIGWAIAEPCMIDMLIHRLQKEFGCTAPKDFSPEYLLKTFGYDLPGDMWKFYKEIDEVTLHFRQANQWNEMSCRILPLKIGEVQLVKHLWDSHSVKGELQYLCDQGEISPELMAERKQFSFGYGELVIIAAPSANADWRGPSVYLVYADRPGPFYLFGLIMNAAVGNYRVGIYRWTGERTPKAFTRVADSFTEWLASLVELSSPRT